jgi:ApaG protein
VEADYVADQSSAENDRYVFAYTVTIRNEGSAAAKLMTRHWIITDADGNENHVRGEGVVGEQPHLRPGEGFRYTSGAVIETPVGSMHGSYQMVDEAGQAFEAPIAPFTLAAPGKLN